MSFLDGDWEPQQTEQCGGANLSLPFFFLSGPMSDLKSYNHPRFNEVSAKLRGHGMNIFNPVWIWNAVVKRVGKDAPYDTVYRKTLAACLEFVLHPQCEGLIVLEGWQASRGSSLEVAAADVIGLPVFTFKFQDELLFLDQWNGKDDQ